ncbi:hypothetical protein AB0L56_29680 [Streptomyces sp. NPDC052079]|uniref:hypothetical protein n=1 Tax=Streptomyces sp. NPDC052079 TaxID=3155526 RepID=UPI00343D4603
MHRAEQMPIRAIARHLGISKNTVKRALANDRPPQYRRPAKGSAVEAVEVQIRELLRETPTVIAPGAAVAGAACAVVGVRRARVRRPRRLWCEPSARPVGHLRFRAVVYRATT